MPSLRHHREGWAHMYMLYSHIEILCFNVWIPLLRKETPHVYSGSIGQNWPLYGRYKIRIWILILILYVCCLSRPRFLSVLSLSLSLSFLSACALSLSFLSACALSLPLISSLLLCLPPCLLSLCVFLICRVPQPKYFISREEQQGRPRATSKFTNIGCERVKHQVCWCYFLCESFSISHLLLVISPPFSPNIMHIIYGLGVLIYGFGVLICGPMVSTFCKVWLSFLYYLALLLPIFIFVHYSVIPYLGSWTWEGDGAFLPDAWSRFFMQLFIYLSDGTYLFDVYLSYVRWSTCIFKFQILYIFMLEHYMYLESHKLVEYGVFTFMVFKAYIKNVSLMWKPFSTFTHMFSVVICGEMLNWTVQYSFLI